MSMTDADIDEITKLLDDVDNKLDNPDSGNDGDGDLGLADMFNETVEAATDAVENATEAATDAVENAAEAAETSTPDEIPPPSDEKADTESKKDEPTAEFSEDLKSVSEGEFSEIEDEGTMVLNEQEPLEEESGSSKHKHKHHHHHHHKDGEHHHKHHHHHHHDKDKPHKKTRKERQELSDMMNLEKNRGDLQKMVDEANQSDNLPKGGKSKKSKRHRKKGKTIKKKGGYVNKKSSSHKTSKKHKKKKSRSSSKTKTSKSSA